jgi:hypothetical protein
MAILNNVKVLIYIYTVSVGRYVTPTIGCGKTCTFRFFVAVYEIWNICVGLGRQSSFRRQLARMLIKKNLKQKQADK